MADAVAARAGRSGRAGHLMVEAGTGVGKSFAYLVPAIQAACASKDYRVVISTHTIRPARTADPQGHSVSAKRHAREILRPARQGPRQLCQQTPAESRASAGQFAADRTRRVRSARRADRLGQHAARTAAAAISISARSPRSGSSSRAIRATAWAKSAPITPIAFTSRPAPIFRRRRC